jgi:hypothetical protein
MNMHMRVIAKDPSFRRYVSVPPHVCKYAHMHRPGCVETNKLCALSPRSNYTDRLLLAGKVDANFCG